jgi:hypothetical protein
MTVVVTGMSNMEAASAGGVRPEQLANLGECVADRGC